MKSDTEHWVWDWLRQPSEGAINNRIKMEVARYGQHRLIYGNDNGAEMIKTPERYARMLPQYSELSKFTEEPVYVTGDRWMMLWHTPIDGDQKTDKRPVYVVLHGRGGHWGDIGKEPGKTVDSRIRLKWLHELSKTGAIVIAPHLSGFGASKRYGGQPSESAFLADVKGIARYLEEHNISSDRVIVGGGSLGGAAAIMLTKVMSDQGKPPALLAVDGSFATLANCVGHLFKLPPQQLRAGIRRGKFESYKRLQSLPPGTSTTIVLMHSQRDPIVNPADSLVNAAAAAKAGVNVKYIDAPDDYFLDGDYHSGMNPDKLIGLMQQFYTEHHAAAQSPGGASPKF
jgi:acetyl esterase/lipase